jgi:hypothetical protein
MIRNIAELLEAIKEKGEKDNLEAIEALGITHTVTIGDMFEGLTQNILRKAVPVDWPELSVSSGMVKDSKGGLSRQIDCMITVGPGIPIPNTTDFIFDIKNVMAVIEVKKTLYSDQLTGACKNLLSVAKLEQTADRPFSLYDTAHRRILGRAAILEGEHDPLPEGLCPIRTSLIHEACIPELIILGYDGFADEHSLRTKFMEYLDGLIAKRNIEQLLPHHLPNLIICREASIVKLNAMPYGVPVEGNEWLLYGSYPENPILLMLEIIFTRLSHYFDKLNQEFFGEDLVQEAPRLLLTTQWLDSAAGPGWAYKPIPLTPEELDEMEPVEDYRPFVLTQAEFVMLSELCKVGRLEESHLPLEVAAELDKLCAKRLIERRGGVVSLLTLGLQVAIDPEMGYICGEDSSGQLTRWLMRRIESRKANNDSSG